MTANVFEEIVAPAEIQPKKEEVVTTSVVETEIKKEEKTQEPVFDFSSVEVGTVVRHSKFGEGEVTWMDKAKKYLRVTFIINGQGVEKQFVFPNAFTMGFLSLEK